MPGKWHTRDEPHLRWHLSCCRLNDKMIDMGYPAVPRMPLHMSILASEPLVRQWVDQMLTPWLEEQVLLLLPSSLDADRLMRPERVSEVADSSQATYLQKFEVGCK